MNFNKCSLKILKIPWKYPYWIFFDGLKVIKNIFEIFLFPIVFYHGKNKRDKVVFKHKPLFTIQVSSIKLNRGFRIAN